MAYNNYFPQYYPQPNFATAQPQMPQQNNSIIWVQGENAAKSYPVSAGQSVLLMDSERSTMYIKSTDQSGMPLPLRIFDYKERQNDAVTHAQASTTNNAEYILRSEFDAFKSEIRDELKEFNSNNQKSVQRPVQNKKE